MPRKSRRYFKSNFYHVMVQGDEKKYIFKNTKNKGKFLYLLKHNAFRNDVEVIAYCIMDNHAHILLFCPELERISKMMLQTNTSFGLAYNNGKKTVGHVFRERFRSESIHSKEYLINCIKYIHENPVKAHICGSCDDYYFSSYNEFSKSSQNILEICDFSQKDINDILKKSHTDEVFIDDEYDKENVEKVFNEITSKKKIMFGDKDYITYIYCEMKERTNAKDMDIAELMGINRMQLFRILKKQGVK